MYQYRILLYFILFSFVLLSIPTKRSIWLGYHRVIFKSMFFHHEPYYYYCTFHLQLTLFFPFQQSSLVKSPSRSSIKKEPALQRKQPNVRSNSTISSKEVMQLELANDKITKSVCINAYNIQSNVTGMTAFFHKQKSYCINFRVSFPGRFPELEAS